MNILPNDIFHIIIKFVPSNDYYNIYRISTRFRNCLKLVYNSNIELQKKPNNDILSSIIYGYGCSTEEEIYKSICDYREKSNYYIIKSGYENLLLYFDVKYSDKLLSHIMINERIINNMTLIKHLEKLNNITRYYTVLLKDSKYNNQTEIYDYIFDKLVNCNDSYQISIMTISVLNHGEIDRAEQLISTGLVKYDIMSILSILVKLNNVILVQTILNNVDKLKQCRYKTLSRHICSDEMQNCINMYFGK